MNIETVIRVEHVNDKLMFITTTREEDFAFIPGQFTMIGLPEMGSDLMRAYSIASPPNRPYLEFYSIKVPGGEFTEPLSKVQVGDSIEVADRPVGSLMTKCLTPGKRLWLLATGTGIAPFMSIVRDPETYEKFDEVILTHTVRTTEELVFKDEIDALIPGLKYYPTVTREHATDVLHGRITAHIDDGSLFHNLGVPEWRPESDRAMVCGSVDFVKHMEQYFKQHNWSLGSVRKPGEFLIERAFVA